MAKDKVPNIREHAIDVVNFQLSMLIYPIPSGLLTMVVIDFQCYLVRCFQYNSNSNKYY